MKRRERILAYIQEQSASYTREQMQGSIGMDAQEIAQALDILRNNVSKELNELQREGCIVKFGGRPVRYFDKAKLEELLDISLGEGPCQFENVEACQPKQETVEAANPFDKLVGAHRSLQKQVEQAKAAILYPPDGLHTLIVGQTGVGKTLFAHLMFEYGKVMHRFAPDAPFVTFNCADYYNNPQLLISHIFGHIKGAFTGADTAKAGLVEEADGGVLFLDEIHRLPPEGQEMIFYFMDTGTYNRLGETTRSRHAKVLIIGATTEDPDSVLTRTFVRRIPNIIKIKPLAERSLSEKIDIISILFRDEAKRVKKPIRVGAESVKALIGSIGNGNVGQLKSNIKLLCAQAFLNGIDNPDYLEVDFRMLPAQIRNGLLTLSANREVLTELTKYLSDYLIITPTGRTVPSEDGEEGSEPFNLYQVVEDKVELLKSEGIESGLIKQVVAADVNVYVRDLYNKKHSVNMTTRERLLKIVDPALVDFAEQVSLYVQKRLNSSYSDCFLYAFSLHLSAFLKRIKSKETIPYTGSEGAVSQNVEYLQIAAEIAGLIEKHYEIQVPHVEVEYIALLLESAKDDDLNDKVIIVVATHGRNTATSMVEVAQKLFRTTDTNLLAVDMPLDVKPQDIYEKLVAMLKTMNVKPGVLILADMGSLCNFGSMIADQLKIEVRTLDMVSTPLILEAMRKADIVGMDLDSIYESLLGFKGYEAVDVTPSDHGQGKPDAVVTICTTGQGAAIKLKAMVEEILNRAGQPMAVLPVGLLHLEEHLDEFASSYHLVAAVGMKKPKRNLPFITLEQIIDGTGEQILLELLDHREMPELAQLMSEAAQEPADKRDIIVRKICEESLQHFLTYLNPSKIIKVLLDFDQTLEQTLGLNLSNPLRIRLIVHCGCALERVVTRSPLVYQGDRSKLDQRKLHALRKASGVFEQVLKLHFEEDELCYMSNML